MSRPAVLIPLVVLLALAAGTGWFVLRPAEVEQPVATAAPEAGPTIPDAPPAPERRVSAPEPARAAPRLPQLPPDPIRDRIAAGEDLHTLHGAVVDEVSREPLRVYTMVCVPIRGGDVRRLIDDPHQARTWSNPLGTFTWRGLPRGSYDLMVRVANYEDLIVPAVEVPRPEGSPPLELALRRGAFVEGTVVALDEEGDEEGLGDLEVRLKPLALDDPYATVVAGLDVTRDDGKFLFTKVAPGTYEVALGNPRLAPQSSRQIYVGPGTGHQVRFVVPEQNEVLVTVRDAEGRALGNVHVRLWLENEGYGMVRGETDADGETELSHVPPGQYQLKAWKHGYRYHAQTLSLQGVRDDVEVAVVLEKETRDLENVTKEELERLKAGERPEDVFGPGKRPR